MFDPFRNFNQLAPARARYVKFSDASKLLDVKTIACRHQIPPFRSLVRNSRTISPIGRQERTARTIETSCCWGI